MSMDTSLDSASLNRRSLALASRGVARFRLADDGFADEVDEELSPATVPNQVTARLELELRQAVERKQFVLHYQPIVSLASGALEGFEALIRWNSPRLGLVGPDDFIPRCEETGLIVPIGFWVMTEACRQLKQWQRQFPSFANLRMSINLSARQLSVPDFVGRVKKILDETGIDPQCVSLEITESMMIQNTDSVIGVLNDLQALGIQLELDDFGMGYSSLNFLHRPPPNGIKIDRSLVQDIGRRRECATVIRAIITMAHNLGWTLVAEGIETREQLAMLQAMDCDKVQGFYFGKPMPAAEAEAYIGEIASKKIDSHDSTGAISQNRFFGESGPLSSAGDLIPASEAKDLVVTDGQLIEPGTPIGSWFGPSNGRTFFGRQSPCKSCAMRACSKLGRSKVPPLSTR
jgi:EAL domain-containing protein (putative c-di-GMP-specific phosphodiesterase class I)